jgi:hypothetical protein
MVTTRDCGTPAASYKLETPAALSETHQAEVALRVKPHAFLRFPSRLGAVGETLLWSTVRSVRVKCCAAAGRVVRANNNPEKATIRALRRRAKNFDIH